MLAFSQVRARNCLGGTIVAYRAKDLLPIFLIPNRVSVLTLWGLSRGLPSSNYMCAPWVWVSPILRGICMVHEENNSQKNTSSVNVHAFEDRVVRVETDRAGSFNQDPALQVCRRTWEGTINGRHWLWGRFLRAWNRNQQEEPDNPEEMTVNHPCYGVLVTDGRQGLKECHQLFPSNVPGTCHERCLSNLIF